MTTLLYFIWFGIPVLFILLALWAKLEQMSGKSRRENPGDFFKQGLFVLGCAGVSLLVDLYLLPRLDEGILPSWLPLLFFRIILFPAVLYIAALIIGPTKDIRIDKAPRLSERRQRRQ